MWPPTSGIVKQGANIEGGKLTYHNQVIVHLCIDRINHPWNNPTTSNSTGSKECHGCSQSMWHWNWGHLHNSHSICPRKFHKKLRPRTHTGIPRRIISQDHRERCVYRKGANRKRIPIHSHTKRLSHILIRTTGSGWRHQEIWNGYGYRLNY